jgi:dephospho-CoA kinase
MPIKQALEERVCKQVRIGLTGEIGAGKSFFAKKYGEFFRRHYQRATGVEARPPLGIVDADLDVIARGILTTGVAPICAEVRAKVSHALGVPFLKDGDIDIKTLDELDIKSLSAKIFSDESMRCAYNDIMIDPILYFLRKDYLSKRGSFVLIWSALLADCGGLPLVNNNIIVVTANEDIRRKRLKQRGYSEQETNLRMAAQFSVDEKVRLIQESQRENSHGSMYVVSNNTEDLSDQEMDKVDSWIQAIPSHLA